MPKEQHPAPRAVTSPRTLIMLLTLVLIISYIDRGNLATAGPLITDELGLSPSQFGTLLSAFYFAYATLMIPAGWLAERYGARPVLAVAVGIWACATLATGFAGSFASLLALRMLLGIGESAVFPAWSKLIRAGVDDSRAGIANGVVSFGYLVGPAIGTFAGGMLMSRFGWRATFWVFGALSLAWLVPWSRVRVAEATTRRGVGSAHVPSFATILRQRALWGASIGNFGINYSFFFVLAWLPTYLVKERGERRHEQSERDGGNRGPGVCPFGSRFATRGVRDRPVDSRRTIGKRHSQGLDDGRLRHRDRRHDRDRRAAARRLNRESLFLRVLRRHLLPANIRCRAGVRRPRGYGPLGRRAEPVRQRRRNHCIGAHWGACREHAFVRRGVCGGCVRQCRGLRGLGTRHASGRTNPLARARDHAAAGHLAPDFGAYERAKAPIRAHIDVAARARVPSGSDDVVTATARRGPRSTGVSTSS